MSILAIKGHATRGREIIEILEMLGGIKEKNFGGSELCCWYYINEYGKIDYHHYSLFNDTKVFTLEEFLEKFPYKVGDKVVDIKTNRIVEIYKLHWSESNNCVFYDVKLLDNTGYVRSYKFLQPYKEETTENIKVDIPKGYEFAGVDDDKQQVIFEKMSCQYPKTYEECSLINGCNNRISLKIIGEFIRLINARNAYWKIAGEQMRLGKPWKPDYKDGCIKYIITVAENEIYTDVSYLFNYILIFPTEEMRDAFLKNFNDLIEECKKLL